MTNNSLQTFKGGWDNLADAKHSTNQTTFLDTPKSFFMRPDGTMIFVLFGNVISAYPLLVPYDPQSKGGLLGTFEITEDTDPVSITFDNVGSKLIVGGSDTMKLYDYDMPANWDITSIVSPPVSIDAAFLSSMGKIAFSTKGDFIFNASLSIFFSFPLPTPFDITSFLGVGTDHNFGFNVASFAWKPQGDRILVTDNAVNDILEFDVSTPWDVTTIVSSGEFFNYGTDITIATDIAIHSNGRQFFTLDETEKAFTRFFLDDDWEIKSASFHTNAESISMDTPNSITWKPDGMIFFVLESANPDFIEAFSVPHPHNTKDAVSLGTFPITTEVNNPKGMYITLDGTKCFVLGTTEKQIFQYDMTSWDITTMSYSGISTGVITLTNPQGMTFDSKGLICYITDATDDIMQYALGVSFDLTTFNEIEIANIDVSTTSPQPADIILKPDDRMLFVISRTNLTVDRYIFGIVGDITSITLVDSLDISPQVSSANALFIQEDNGNQVFVIDVTNKMIFTFNQSQELVYSIQENLGDWFDFSWQHRIPLTVNNTMVPSEQSNFPTLINNTFPSLIGVELRELRFAGPDKVQLQYEIQEFNNTTGELIAWVKKPTISNGDIIYIYYDSETATDEQNPQVVWSDYSYVAHLNNIPAGSGSILDSSPNPKNGTPINNPTQVDGVIGKALNFDGSTSYIDLGLIEAGDKLMLDGEDLVISFILKPDLSGDDFQRIISKSTASAGFDGYGVAINNDMLILYQDAARSINSNDGIIGTAEHFHVTFSKQDTSGVAQCYVNGVDQFFDAPNNRSNPNVSAPMKIARWNHTDDRHYKGDLEHLTISTNIPTPDRIITEYNNTHDNSMFFSTGFIQSLTFTENSIIAETETEIIDEKGAVLIYQ